MAREQRPDPTFFQLRVRLSGLIVAAGVICLSATICGFLASASWFLELFAHFRVQYLLALVLCAALAVRRYRKWAIVFSAGAAANLCTIVPLFLDGEPQRPAAPSTEKPLRVVALNVNTQHGDVQRVSALLERLDADFVVLQEINTRWVSKLRPFTDRYPGSLVRPSEDNFGIALFSKHPFESAEVVHVGPGNAPAVVAVVHLSGKPLTLLAGHPYPPAGAYHAAMRNSQLEGIARRARAAPRPLLLLGDLNVTPWSPWFRQLLRDSDLMDSARGYGVQPSWPTWMPLLLIPIDHCLHSHDLHIVRRQLGPYVGSDHFPLIVDFALP